MSSVHTSGNVRPRCFLLLARGVVLRLALAATALAFTSSPAIAFAQQPAPANEVVPPKLTKDSPAL
ncbi:MAG: hypothetical protein KIT84_44220, partial [Labilithrix sp.]|nr:hypothetical protein [Labilithrix sp.]